MKHALLATGLGLATLSGIAQATPEYHPSGSNLVYGDVSNGYSILSGINNPAAGASTFKSGEGGIDIGLFSSIGIGVEIGDVNNIYDQIDATANEFSATFDSITATSTADASAVTNAITTTINDTNNLLSLIDKSGYAKVFGSLHWPLMPIKVSGDWLGGSLVFDANSSLEARLGLVEDAIDINSSTLLNDISTAIGTGTTQTNGDLTFTYDNTTNNVNFTVTNDSTAIVKAALVHELSLAYSRKIWSNANNNLSAGFRGKYYHVELWQDFERIATVANSQNLFDNATSQDRTTNTGFGLDVGVLWMTSNFHLGATVTNLNEPSFDYNTINMSALGYTDTTTINKLEPSDTYTMQRQLKLESALYTQNKHWIIGAGVDANAVEDPLGDKYQWAVVSAAYLSDHWWLPAVRAGYRSNRAGSKLNYLTFGFTLFKGFNFDLAYSPSKVEVNGSSQTRSFMANIGLDISF